MKILVLLSGLILLALAPVQAAEPAPPNITAGKALAEKLCARCHATGREGKSTHKKAPPFRTFASKWPLESLEEALAEGIVVGHHAMPKFKFKPEQIADLLGYIATLPAK
jgi:mono/diheme cytochrome c family protein